MTIAEEAELTSQEELQGLAARWETNSYVVRSIWKTHQNRIYGKFQKEKLPALRISVKKIVYQRRRPMPWG